MKIIISEKQIVKIEDFMELYIGKVYDSKEKLTHSKMEEYLFKNGYIIPTKINFNRVTKEKILTGEYLAVRDEKCQVLFYRNPRKSLDNLLSELHSDENIKVSQKRRKQLLDDLDLVDTNIGVLEKELFEKEEYNLEKQNRQKQFVMCKRTYLRKRHY